MTTQLIPADTLQCQVEITTNEVWRLGPAKRTDRCTNPPVVVALETTPGPDGQRGSMSICAGCLKAFFKTSPPEMIDGVDLYSVAQWNLRKDNT